MRASRDVGRAGPVAIFAIRPKFERHVSSPEDAEALKRGPASRGTQSVAGQACLTLPGRCKIASIRSANCTPSPSAAGSWAIAAGGCIATIRRLSGSRWKNKHWLICVCEFKGRRRDVWGRYYTELFFLDEPTALAAGHRPCFECRRQAAKAFIAAFPGAPSHVEAMDEALHRERVENRQKRLWQARLGDLPDGAMIARDGRAHAVRAGMLSPWNFAGYGAPEPLDPDAVEDVLTPPSTVAALKAGYKPLWPEAIISR